MPEPTVLIGWRRHDRDGRPLRDRVAGWVEDLGYDPAVSEDADEVVAWVRDRVFVASLLDSGLAAETGEQVWRAVRPIVGRRLVLMAREPRRGIWFEALGCGVGAVLPFPPGPTSVRAALEAVTVRGGTQGSVHGRRA